MEKDSFREQFLDYDKDELIAALHFHWKKYYALVEALKHAPRLPSPYVLGHLGRCPGVIQWPADADKGKEMQRILGSDAIPYVSECESGAGCWDRLTGGAWQLSNGYPMDAEAEKPC